MGPLDLVAPFPYFGGKRAAAAHVWAALGPVDNYVEPFFGSGAALLLRPGKPRVETVNDADGLLANVWRAMRADPEAVAHHADWPVNEADLHARHLWLVGQRERLTERMMADADAYDAKAAGWWIWGACAWIGSGWCSGTGPWQAVDGVLTNVKASGNNGQGINRQLPHLGNNGQGINRKLPHLGNNGRGINRKLPHLGDNGRGINGARGAALSAWFAALSERLRDVRVACGDWSRVLGPSASYAHPTVKSGGWCGIFLDPPYGDVGTADLYAHDSRTVAAEVRAWCLEHAREPRTRIVLAGYAGQGHEPLEECGWRAVRWGETTTGYAVGGYGNRNKDGSQFKRETLWLSPHCLAPQEERQLSLIGGA